MIMCVIVLLAQMLCTSLLSPLTCLIIAACLEWVTVSTLDACGAYALHTSTATIGLLSVM